MYKINIFAIFTILISLIGCETKNPGEAYYNELPDTHISEAIAGNVTTIIVYVTDDDVTTWKFAYKWDTDIDWSFTDYNIAGVDTLVFYDIFTHQNEIKTFYVKAIDAKNNEDPYPAEISLSPNNIPPTTFILSGPEFGQETGPDVTFVFTGSDIDEGGAVVAFQYTMDDVNNWQSTPDSIPQAIYTGLTVGLHTFYVRAEDNLGGVDPSPAQVTFIVRN